MYVHMNRQNDIEFFFVFFVCIFSCAYGHSFVESNGTRVYMMGMTDKSVVPILREIYD